MQARISLTVVFASILASLAAAQSALDADLQLLKTHGVGTETPKLLDYFRLRTLRPGDREQLTDMVARLSTGTFIERDKAVKDLIQRGPLAIPYLKAALKDTSQETVRRVEICIKAITQDAGVEQSIAAARILAERQADGALEVVLAYYPFAEDPWLQEELLTCVGKLAFHQGKIDPILIKTLKDGLSAQRASAAYVLAQRSGFSLREELRTLLADPDVGVRTMVVQGLLGKRVLKALEDSAAGDAELLKKYGVGGNESALLDFLQKKTLSAKDQDRLRGLIRQLGDPSFSRRSEASRLLTEIGTPALAFLTEALHDADVEIARRAQLGILEIRKGPGPALPAAVIRSLARLPLKASADAIQVLLAYVPFAEDESLEDDVLSTLSVLCTRQAPLDADLVKALDDPLAVRRASAALVLGRVGTAQYQAALRKLLHDGSVKVRWRAAQGLLAGKDREAIPPLIGLLADLPAAHAWQVEETLFRLAGAGAPAAMVADGAGPHRAAAVKAWSQWWQSQGPAIDLARGDDDHFLGLFTICEYDSMVGGQGGQVWETSRDGKARWKIANLNGAMDAQVLPNGRVLVAENPAGRVTERDLQGNVKWQYQAQGNPIACQRLPNGNTFIATYNHVFEVTPDGKELYRYTKGPGFYIFSAQKTRTGNIVCMSAQGTILEMEAKSGKEIRSIHLGPAAGWCSVEALTNGRYLVATLNNGQVREVDAGGQVHWTVNFPGAFRATRLPNGNTMVASMTQRQIAEFDRSGALRWQKTCDGRPWGIRYR